MNKIKFSIIICLLNLCAFSVSAANWPFQSAIRIDNTLYLSGQMGLQYPQVKMVEGGVKEETKQAMNNIKRVLEENGYTMNNLVKCLVMLTDMAEWEKMNESYKTFFPNGNYPTRSAFGVSALALNGKVEIECLAVKNYRLNKKGATP